ncbi:MAG TPA: stage V sporulation protein AD [Firmicutes bacterium]|nr:stage V sporulation protein AD [Candidatus Fermentithermobacillaceae bacterium]
MEFHRRGTSTCVFKEMPVVVSAAAVVGPREGKGPLGDLFDMVYSNTLFGESSWEKAESKMLRQAVDLALAKAKLDETQVDFLIAGDLLNQIISSAYMAREYDIPFLGIYGACATISEGMGLGSMLIAGRFARQVVVASSSHHDAAERQFRYPTEFGHQRPPTGQWTATAAGAVVLGAKGKGPRVEAVTIGRVQDLGVVEPNDMGSAMAPGFADTVWRHLQDMGRKPEDYDLVVSGDLGRVGSLIGRQLLRDKGIVIDEIHQDAGVMLYDPSPEVGSGGSGCGCVASVFSGKLWKELYNKQYERILVVATGALHSPTSCQQGESIPCVAHAVSIVSEE